MWSPGTHSTQMKGPVPFGFVVICTWVASFQYIWIVARAQRSDGYCELRWKRTVTGSAASTELIDEMIEAFGEAVAGFWMRSIENVTSAEVKSSPLWNLTLGWRFISSTVGSGKLQSLASSDLT